MSTTKRATKAKGSTGNRNRKQKRRKPFVPTKGGDGGRAAKVNRGPNWSANAKVVLTGASIRCRADRDAFELLLVETSDPCDRAHNQKKLEDPRLPPQLDASWVLCVLGEIDLPGRAPRSRPRRYHPSQIVGRVEHDEDGVVTFDNRVGLDSMFDHAAAVAARFERAGIVLGWGTSYPRERSMPLASRRAQEMAGYFAGMSDQQVRNRVQQRTSVAMDPGEIEAQRAGTAILRANTVDWDGMDE